MDGYGCVLDLHASMGTVLVCLANRAVRYVCVCRSVCVCMYVCAQNEIRIQYLYKEKGYAMLPYPGADDVKLLNISSISLSVVGLRNIVFWFGWGKYSANVVLGMGICSARFSPILIKKNR